MFFFQQGLTIQVDENGNLIIARILGGSTAARQGLVRPGEVILEVNGKSVRNPDELQLAIQDAKENLTLKLAPGIAEDGNRPIKSTVSLFCISVKKRKDFMITNLYLTR